MVKTSLSTPYKKCAVLQLTSDPRLDAVPDACHDDAIQHGPQGPPDAPTGTTDNLQLFSAHLTYDRAQSFATSTYGKTDVIGGANAPGGRNEQAGNRCSRQSDARSSQADEQGLHVQ